MNVPNTQNPQSGPLTGIIKFLAIVGLLTIFAAGIILGVAVVSFMG